MTSSRNPFSELRNILADLYPDEAGARRIVADVGLDMRRIAFGARAIDTWHSILTEATKTRQTSELFATVQREYAATQTLTAACEAYQAIISQGDDPLADFLAPAPGESPYKGLQFFDVSDADLFFGREQLTAELVNRLRQQRFLAVVGASGSGKSSVVRAGLVPALTQGKPLADGTKPPEGYQAQHVHIITPTALPLESLASSLTHRQESVTAVTTLVDDLAKDPRSLRLYVRRLLAGSTSTDRLLLVVDQFEELFTLCRDLVQRQAFVDNLLTAANEESQVVVVITLRADFYGHCAAFANLRTALATCQAYIGPMTQADLRRAIEEPAQIGEWTLEPGLVDLILADTGQEPGALPLLAHALLETWQRRQGRILTLAGYTASGRVQGAIAQTAERVYQNLLSTEEQRIARAIFLSLTELGEGAEDTRRRVALQDLFTSAGVQPAVEKVLNILTNARLITTDEAQLRSGQQANQAHVEVAHEALIRVWPALRQWLDGNREGLRLHRQLSEAAQSWLVLKRDAGALYSGLRLQQTLYWQRSYQTPLTPLEAVFLKASKQRRDLFRLAIGLLAVIVFAVMGWLSWAQVKELRFAHAQQAVSPLILLGDAAGAVQQLQLAHALYPDRFDLPPAIAAVKRKVATKLVQQGEALAAHGDHQGASAQFKAALALMPPPDTPVYVWIPVGEFTMGSSDTDRNARNDEKPPHKMKVDGFWLLRTEVTNAQYKRCVDAHACEQPNNPWWDKTLHAQQPVASVDWKQANAYAEWVGGRLPSEAEWEHACRGADKRIYPWGNESAIPERLNYVASGLNAVNDVGSYPPGNNDLYDMAGNVWEWTDSWYESYPYKADDGRENPNTGGIRTLRGGSFEDVALNVRCAARLSYFPYDRYTNVGFRVLSRGP